jgi:DNA-binding CsgD family transcriptional regulator
MSPSLDRALLYRSTFVGREAELQQLHARFDATLGGQGSIVAILGEPGIGKTALCDQLATYARSHGARTLLGRCYGASSLNVPYLPVVEALRAYVLGLDLEILRIQLGNNAADLARLLPEIGARLNGPDTEPSDLENQQWRLFQSVSDFVRVIGESKPLVLILEDLHDADRGTLDLLVHLSRNLAGARLLVVATYRDIEVTRAHPLSGALAELRRSSQFVRLPLRGLNEDEVQRMLASISEQAVSQAFVELVYQQTEGNPLFVQELLRYLVERDLVEARDGSLQRAGEASLAERIPEGLRDVIGQRLSTLTERTNQVLALASVLGREFRLDTLVQMTDVTEDDVTSALDEAARASLVEEQPTRGFVTYRFTHALFRQTLYEEISAPRRIRFHQQTARILEQVYGGHAEDHAAEIAEHYAHSSDRDDLAHAVAYWEQAARRASQVYAHGDTVRCLERAVEILEISNPGDVAKRCDLLLALGAALTLSGAPRRTLDLVAPATLSLAEQLHDAARAFDAAILALDALPPLGSGSAMASPEFLQWAEIADQYASPDGIQRALADNALASAWMVRGRAREARALLNRALESARVLGDSSLMFELVWKLIRWGAPAFWPELVALADEFSRRPRDGVSPRLLGNVLFSCAGIQLAESQYDRFLQTLHESSRIHRRGYPAGAYVLEPVREAAWLALLDGNLHAAVEFTETFVARAKEAGRADFARFIARQRMFLPLLYLGEPEHLLSLVSDDASNTRASGQDSVTALIAAVCLSHLGRVDEARLLVGPLLESELEEEPIEELHLRLQLAVMWDDHSAAACLAEQLDPVAHVSYTMAGCVGRALGASWGMRGDAARARAAFEQAIRVCQASHFRPEAALARLDLAELLLLHYPQERVVALEQLDIAAAELRAMGMQPALEHAVAIVRPSVSDGLTVREREVVALIASGMTNRQVAETLVISEGTAEVHVKHILSKLGLKSRVQVAGWAADHGLRRSARLTASGESNSTGGWLFPE